MESSEAVRALAALSQETRLAAFRLLVQAGSEGLPAGRIAEALGVALPTLSFHLKELHQAGLVTTQSVSRFVIYRASYDQMNDLLGFMTLNCCRGVPGDAEPAPGCRPTCAQPPTPERNPA